MAKGKVKTVFVCQQCAATSARWQGRCPSCGAWNSLVEAVGNGGTSRSSWLDSAISPAPSPIDRIERASYQRTKIRASPEFDRVLGGGIVPGSLVLIGGDPGVGKSTLLLQIAGAIANDQSVLYVSGEESPEQIRLRADRLAITNPQLLVLAETNLNGIVGHIEALRPGLVVIDSIQTVYVDDLESAAGSVGQLRECTMRLMHLAKSLRLPVFLVGHVTKDGTIAGPRVLEHIVDAVLYLEGERFNAYRLLRGVKNRFGSTNEVGVFEMSGEGLADVPNPSAAFLAERPEEVPGSAVVVTMEGTRPILVEVQALTTTTSFGLPRRAANGIDFNRLLMVVAVLSKRVGINLGNQDVYVNVVGGMKIDEPAADLGLALAIASSYSGTAIAQDLVAVGEIGLSGELRRVSHTERRLGEAAKLGFRRCILPRSLRPSPKPEGIASIEVANVADAIRIAPLRP